MNEEFKRERLTSSPDLSLKIGRITPAKYVGGYRFGGTYFTQFNMSEKPCWFHRKMVKLVLGWEWVDV